MGAGGTERHPHSERAPTPRALSHNEVRDMVGKWGEAAARADKCGFDVLEIHAAHGYLLHQFLSPAANQRTDEYGGSEANRMRFPTEVAEAVRAITVTEVAKARPFAVGSLRAAISQTGLLRRIHVRGIDTAGRCLPRRCMHRRQVRPRVTAWG